MIEGAFIGGLIILLFVTIIILYLDILFTKNKDKNGTN